MADLGDEVGVIQAELKRYWAAIKELFTHVKLLASAVGNCRENTSVVTSLATIIILLSVACGSEQIGVLRRQLDWKAH